MEYTANHVILRGTLTGLPEFSHENHSRKFYRFSLEVERLSGTTDILPVMAAEDVLEAMDLFCGGRIEVEGQLRSFNNRSGQGRKLILSVFARSLAITPDAAPLNRIRLCGAVCKPPVRRSTPLGREVCDILLAVNRRCGGPDQPPVIAWGLLARQAAELDTGDCFCAEGRVQSRVYLKVTEGTTQQRTAYEVSVMHMTEREDFPPE